MFGMTFNILKTFIIHNLWETDFQRIEMLSDSDSWQRQD